MTTIKCVMNHKEHRTLIRTKSLRISIKRFKYVVVCELHGSLTVAYNRHLLLDFIAFKYDDHCPHLNSTSARRGYSLCATIETDLLVGQTLIRWDDIMANWFQRRKAANQARVIRFINATNRKTKTSSLQALYQA